MARGRFTDEQRKDWADYARSHGEQAAADGARVKRRTIQQWKRDHPGSSSSVTAVLSGQKAGTAGSVSQQGAGVTPPPPLTNRQFHNAMDRSARAFAARRAEMVR